MLALVVSRIAVDTLSMKVGRPKMESCREKAARSPVSDVLNQDWARSIDEYNVRLKDSAGRGVQRLTSQAKLPKSAMKNA